MKKLLTLFSMMFVVVLGGCTTEVSIPKENYNVAVLSFSVPYDVSITTSKTYADNMEKYYYQYYDSTSTALKIVDYEYISNNLIKLYLPNDRTIETDKTNVMLMYDPNVK